MALRCVSSLSKKKNNPEATRIIIGIEKLVPLPDNDFKPINRESK